MNKCVVTHLEINNNHQMYTEIIKVNKRGYIKKINLENTTLYPQGSVNDILKYIIKITFSNNYLIIRVLCRTLYI